MRPAKGWQIELWTGYIAGDADRAATFHRTTGVLDDLARIQLAVGERRVCPLFVLEIFRLLRPGPSVPLTCRKTSTLDPAFADTTSSSPALLLVRLLHVRRRLCMRRRLRVWWWLSLLRGIGIDIRVRPYYQPSAKLVPALLCSPAYLVGARRRTRPEPPARSRECMAARRGGYSAAARTAAAAWWLWCHTQSLHARGSLPPA